MATLSGCLWQVATLYLLERITFLRTTNKFIWGKLWKLLFCVFCFYCLQERPQIFFSPYNLFSFYSPSGLFLVLLALFKWFAVCPLLTSSRKSRKYMSLIGNSGDPLPPFFFCSHFLAYVNSVSFRQWFLLRENFRSFFAYNGMNFAILLFFQRQFSQCAVFLWANNREYMVLWPWRVKPV